MGIDKADGELLFAHFCSPFKVFVSPICYSPRYAENTLRVSLI